MKAHLAAHPLPPKTTHQQLGDTTTESASSSSSSSGEEQELKDKSLEVTEEKSLAYGLRNNPKKSFRLADPEFSFAVDSGSVVQDRESETESRNPTRRRSKRTRKLFTAQDQKQQQNLEIKKPKSSNLVESATEPEPVSSVSDTSPEEDVAMCLMMLSRDVWMRNNGEQDQENCKERERSLEMVEESKEIKPVRGKHRCEKCKKVFRSYHALGGHKKVCEAAETRNAAAAAAGGGKVCSDEKIFECPFCYKVFGSGQALGGHKRSHLLATSSTAVAHSAKVENNLIDLNLPAPLEEDDYSVVSDA